MTSTNNQSVMVNVEGGDVMNKSRVIVKEIAGLLVQSTNLVVNEIKMVHVEVNELRSEVYDIKRTVEEIRRAVAPTHAERAINDGQVACKCGKALSKGEVEYCRANNLEYSCYRCRSTKTYVSNYKPSTQTPVTGDGKNTYTGRCKHSFRYTPAKYAEYVKRCRELNIPLVLCPSCAKRVYDQMVATNPQEQHEEVPVQVQQQPQQELSPEITVGVTQGF